MINWDELKHIHVIRKLEGILAQWFYTEIFFVDERGQIKNYDPLDRQREFKNPICATLLPQEKGKILLLNAIHDANEKAYASDTPHLVIAGPTGVENILVSRIVIDNEFLGSVFAFCYIDQPVPAEKKVKARALIESA
jgi:hypothetical protein